MVAAPPSWAVATNRAPAATIAFGAWKLPLPTTPKTWSTPCATRCPPMRSATVMGAPRFARSPLDEGQHAARAAGAPDDRQRSGDDHRTRRRQCGHVAQLGQPVLVVSEQERVTGE